MSSSEIDSLKKPTGDNQNIFISATGSLITSKTFHFLPVDSRPVANENALLPREKKEEDSAPSRSLTQGFLDLGSLA